MSRLWIFIIGLLSLYAVRADSFGYSPYGGMVSFGEFDYVYDSASRLTEVWPNGEMVVESRYDALGRRVIKWTPEATHTFVYDVIFGDRPRETNHLCALCLSASLREKIRVDTPHGRRVDTPLTRR